MRAVICETTSEDVLVSDAEEDAPLITVTFHNQARRIPLDVKKKLVRQMIGPSPWRQAWVIPVLWFLGGLLTQLCVDLLIRRLGR